MLLQFAIRTILVIMILAGGASLSSCTDDPGYEERWYLSGSWQCLDYPQEVLYFDLDGSGYWENVYTGDYEGFQYYCDGNYLYFQWQPQFGPWYSEDCYIYVVNDNAIQITYPASSNYGPQTLYYSRL